MGILLDPLEDFVGVADEAGLVVLFFLLLLCLPVLDVLVDLVDAHFLDLLAGEI